VAPDFHLALVVREGVLEELPRALLHLLRLGDPVLVQKRQAPAVRLLSPDAVALPAPVVGPRALDALQGGEPEPLVRGPDPAPLRGHGAQADEERDGGGPRGEADRPHPGEQRPDRERDPHHREVQEPLRGRDSDRRVEVRGREDRDEEPEGGEGEPSAPPERPDERRQESADHRREARQRQEVGAGDLDQVPPEAVDSFAGVGYHFGLAEAEKRNQVLDLGSGSGMDLFIASLKTGMTGSVVGVDMTDEQLKKSRELAGKYEFNNVSFVKSYIEELPFGKSAFDVVISNGVINLSAEKARVFQQISKVLKKGGKMAISDIVTKSQMPASITCNSTNITMPLYCS